MDSEDSDSDQGPNMTLWAHLSRDYIELLNSGDYSDLTIRVEAKNEQKEFRAHSLILCARSKYFRKALSSELVKKENSMIVFEKPNVSFTYKFFFRYIY